MAEWPYSTGRWQRLRRAKLRAQPLCEPCRMRGQLRFANTVDHVLAISAGGDPFPPLDGLMSMCGSCHGAKTAAIEREGGTGVAFKGCGVDGMPIDSAHPFNGPISQTLCARDVPDAPKPTGPRDSTPPPSTKRRTWV